MKDKVIKAYGKRVLIKPIEEPEKSEGGIIIPKSAEKNPTSQGVVVSVGELVEQYLDLGEHVLYFSQAGVEVVSEGQKLHLVNPENILAILP